MTLEYIRKTYGVPAKRGGRIVYTGSTKGPLIGTIIRGGDSCLVVRLDGYPQVVRLHPTWEIQYLSGLAPVPSAGDEEER